MGNRFVAVCDILGFKYLLDRLPLTELASRITLLLDGVGSLRRPFVTATDRLRPGLYRPNNANFSDSIILWSDAQRDLAEAFSNGIMFTQCLAELVGRAFVSQIPLRMGVAYGETFVDVSRNILLGKPVADAFLLEKAQEWIGGAFHSSVPLHTIDHDGVGIVHYPVPLKPEAPEPCSLAVDWCFVSAGAQETSATITNVETALSTYLREAPNEGVRLKYLNTQGFCKSRMYQASKG